MLTQMKIKSKVVKFSQQRKIIELPKSVRDNFKIGEQVYIEGETKMIDGIRQIMFEHTCPVCNKYIAALTSKELTAKIGKHKHDNDPTPLN